MDHERGGMVLGLVLAVILGPLMVAAALLAVLAFVATLTGWGPGFLERQAALDLLYNPPGGGNGTPVRFITFMVSGGVAAACYLLIGWAADRQSSVTTNDFVNRSGADAPELDQPSVRERDDSEAGGRPWVRSVVYLCLVVLVLAASISSFVIIGNRRDVSDTVTRDRPPARLCTLVDDVVVSLRAFAADPTTSRQGDVDEDLRHLSREANASSDNDLSVTAGRARTEWAAYSRARSSGTRAAEEAAYDAVVQAISGLEAACHPTNTTTPSP